MTAQHELDTVGLVCPEPIMLLHKAIRKANTGDIIMVMASDPATTRDIPNFCRHLGHALVEQAILDDGNYRYMIQKG
ncbi:sulfurtransferase TusA [Moraxella oblonga]|uniref:sulfurtransferase TusA n=1 Tax=Moraxella oblonga TaxID=200413 RepID=UPI000829C94A|nr:sulfurtransferase TusA [Moraxella oblonga]